MLHKDIPVGVDSSHPPGYVQSSDPGAVGANKIWIDSTAAPYVHKIRNAGNSAWVAVGSGGGTGSSTSADYFLTTGLRPY